MIGYDEYISSPHWATRRSRHLRRQKTCRACGAGANLQVHHLSYGRMGAELDADLMTLCATCHEYVHAYHRAHPKLTLRGATLKAVKALQSSRWIQGVPASPKFTPLRQRVSVEERQGEITSGKQGRLGGLPLRVAHTGPSGGARSLTHRDT